MAGHLQTGEWNIYKHLVQFVAHPFELTTAKTTAEIMAKTSKLITFYLLLITAKIGSIISWPKQRLKLRLVSAEWVSIFGRDKSKNIQLVKRSFCRSFLAVVLFFNQFIVMKTFSSNYVLNFTLKFLCLKYI